MNALLAELRRRNVFRVAAAYLVVGWLVMQVISVISDAAGLPGWADSLALILLLAGLPVAVFIAWAFEMTPTGLKPTENVDPEASLARATTSTLDIAILVGLALVAVLMVSSWFWPRNATETTPSEVVAEVVAPDAPEAPAAEIDEISSAETQAGPPALSVAVLPFVAMSSDVEDRYFAEGLTEEILNYLAAVPELLVTSRTSAFQFRGDDLPSVPEIAQQLGVAHIVEGSIRRSGDRVRVTAQIIRAADDSHLWSQTYDRTMDDVFAIQDDIAQNITAVLDIVLDEDQLARMGEIGVQNVEAYIAYQRGVEISVEAHDRRVDTLTALEPAEALFAEATRLAPDFSDAYMRQADYYAHMMSRSEREDTEEARATLEMATDRYFDLLELAKDSTTDPNRRAMIDVDRIYLRQSWTGAGPILDRASRTTGCPFTAWLRELSALSGRSPALLPYAQRMTRCDPLSGTNWSVLSSIAYSAGEFDIAHDAASNGLRLDSRDVDLMWQSADALFQAGREDDIAEYMDFLQVPDYVRGLYAAMFAARAGDREAANEARLLMGETHELDGYALRLHAMLGEREAANAGAALLDARAGSLDVMIAITAACRCGAVWDLEATPNFARRMAEADFPWPPPGGENFPLKDW